VNIFFHIGKRLLHGVPKGGHLRQYRFSLSSTRFLTSLQTFLIATLLGFSKKLCLLRLDIGWRNNSQCWGLPSGGAG
jgi:hypothetical protein